MLEIRLLNEQRIIGGPGTPGRTPSSRSVALLAYLILHADVPQARQHLAGVFWPDSNEAQARTNLRRELHNLRALVGDDPSLVVEPTTLTWHDSPSCRVDVRVFETEHRCALTAKAREDTARFAVHAESALAAYGGDLMPGSYEDWVLEEREPLLRKCADLCDLLIRACRDSGDRARALEVARRRVQLKPLEEPGYRLLMELQAESGDRAAAVSTYHRCAAVLEHELGVEPDPETTAMVERLLDRVPAPLNRRASTPDPLRRSGRAGAGLIGRTGEVGLLADRWRLATSGHIGLLVVSGEAGVGKSRLVAELATVAAAEGAVVATSRCFGQSGRLALAPVADWLRSSDLRSATTALERVWKIEVDRLVPRHETRTSADRSTGGNKSTDPSTGRIDAWQRHRFFEGLARAVLGTERPVLLVLDDLQWCDEETLTWLAFLLGFAEDARLLVATTVRSEELDENREVASSLRAMRSAGLVTDINLSPLEPSETCELAVSLLGRPLSTDEDVLLHAATGGYPLFVVEAARGLPDLAASGQALPDNDLTSVLRHRLEQTSAAAREVAGLAAAVGHDFNLDLLSEASDLDADALVRAVDELWRRRILRDQRSGYDFSHDLLRDAAYSLVSPPRRWLLHRRLAQGIELLHAGHVDDVAAQLAEQYDRGGRPDRALGYFRRAAEVAGDVFANAEAIRHYRRCLDLVAQMPAGRDRDEHELDVLEAMSAPLNALYGYSSAVLQTTLERSATLAEGLGRPRVLARILVGLFSSRFVQGQIAKAHELAERALELGEADPDLAGQAHFGFAGSATSLGMLETAITHFDLALDISPSAVAFILGTHYTVHAQAWAAHAHWLHGDQEEAGLRCADAIERGRSVDHPYSLAVALAYAAITHQLSGNKTSLRDAVTELRELCQRYEFAYYGEWGLVLDGWATGGENGVAQIRLGITRLRSLGAYARMPFWLSLLAEALIDLGRTGEASAVLDSAIVAAEQRDDRWWLPEVLRLRAGLDPGPGGRDMLERAIRLASAHSSRTLESRCQADLAARSVPASPERRRRGANAPRTAHP